MTRANTSFESAAPETLELLETFNYEKRCTFLTSSNYMHADTAKLGYLLSAILTRAHRATTPYRTFFVNSSLEALSGAIKLVRQTSVRNRKSDGGWILLVDEGNRFAPFLDPTGRGEEAGTTPNVRFASSAAAALPMVSEHNWSGLIHVREPAAAGAGSTPAGEAHDALLRLVDSARRQGALIVAVDSELELGSAAFAIHDYPPDVVVYGENLTDRQVPFGCFTMTEKAHLVWNNDVDCFAQTSTFGGNRLCAAAALLALDRNGHVSEQDREQFRQIDGNFKTMLQVWGRHVNPGMAALGPIFGMDIDVQQAWGGRFRTSDGREILDCSAGFGSNLRGHNCADIPDLLRAHDPAYDYFADLEKLFLTLTKFDHAFPAVSGATAVDIAATLGLLANPGRRKVVTFDGNFSGKSLFALNFSKRGPQLTESDKDAFRPYYAELVYLDPFADDAVEQLTQVLRGGDVALVWFEMIRGGMCEHLPKPILDVIDRLKHQYGYLIGVDEVLTGGWRTGNSYLAHQGKLSGSDIVSIGKTLSDMTLPMAAVLVTDAVYERARQTNPAHVERLKKHYRNQLSANIALNALSHVSSEECRSAIVLRQQTVEEGLREIVGASKLFGGVRGYGGLLLLAMNKKYFPFHHRSKLGNMLELAMSHLIFVRCGVLVFLLRFLHRVSTTDADTQELLDRLKQGLAGVTPFMVYRYALSRILSQKLPSLSVILAGRAAKSDVAPHLLEDVWWAAGQEPCRDGRAK